MLIFSHSLKICPCGKTFSLTLLYKLVLTWREKMGWRWVHHILPINHPCLGLALHVTSLFEQSQPSSPLQGAPSWSLSFECAGDGGGWVGFVGMWLVEHPPSQLAKLLPIVPSLHLLGIWSVALSQFAVSSWLCC